MAETIDSPRPQADATPTPSPTSTTEQDWRSAVDHGLVSLFQLATAFYQTLDADAEIRASAGRWYPALLEGYQRTYGGIKQQYHGQNHPCAAVLTDQDRIDIITPAVDGKMSQALALVADCDALTIRMTNVLDPGVSRRTLIETVYGVVVAALGVIEYAAADAEPDPSRVELVQSRLDTAKALYEQAAQRQAKVQYFNGVLWGLLGVLIVIGLASVLLSRLPDVGFTPAPLAAACIAGALGATVSVLARLTVGRLTLDTEAGSGQLMKFGVVRPFLGAVFGLAVYWLASGGLVPVKIPDSTVGAMFYAGLAFLAGFSERFAQDMFSLGERGVTNSKVSGDGSSGPPAATDKKHVDKGPKVSNENLHAADSAGHVEGEKSGGKPPPPPEEPPTG
jgi:hypothetical protein